MTHRTALQAAASVFATIWHLNDQANLELVELLTGIDIRARAEEREACARIADRVPFPDYDPGYTYMAAANKAHEVIAAQIRARGEKEQPS